MKSITLYLLEVMMPPSPPSPPQSPMIKNTLPIEVLQMARRNPVFANQVNTSMAELKRMALLQKLKPTTYQ